MLKDEPRRGWPLAPRKGAGGLLSSRRASSTRPSFAVRGRARVRRRRRVGVVWGGGAQFGAGRYGSGRGCGSGCVVRQGWGGGLGAPRGGRSARARHSCRWGPPAHRGVRLVRRAGRRLVMAGKQEAARERGAILTFDIRGGRGGRTKGPTLTLPSKFDLTRV